MVHSRHVFFSPEGTYPKKITGTPRSFGSLWRWSSSTPSWWSPWVLAKKSVDQLPKIVVSQWGWLLHWKIRWEKNIYACYKCSDIHTQTTPWILCERLFSCVPGVPGRDDSNISILGDFVNLQVFIYPLCLIPIVGWMIILCWLMSIVFLLPNIWVIIAIHGMENSFLINKVWRDDILGFEHISESICLREHLQETSIFHRKSHSFLIFP